MTCCRMTSRLRARGATEIEIQNEQFGLTYAETMDEIHFEADEIIKCSSIR